MDQSHDSNESHEFHPSVENVPFVNTTIHESNIRCLRCKYDLTGIALGAYCPECGEPVSHSIKNTSLGVSGSAMASLILGILAFPACLCYGIPSLVLGGLAIMFFFIARKEIRQGHVDANSSWTLALAGLICGITATALSLVGLLLMTLAILIP